MARTLWTQIGRFQPCCRTVTGHKRPGVTILPTPEDDALRVRHRGPVSSRGWAVVFALGVALASGCAVAMTPEQTAEGALRSRLNASVAPDGYRSGRLSVDLAAAWRARVATDLVAWYRKNLAALHLMGTAHTARDLMERPGPIVTFVDFRRVVIPRASIDGDSARIDGAAIEYTTHFAPGSWDEEVLDGTTMCRFELRRVDARWLVEEETCNESGG